MIDGRRVAGVALAVAAGAVTIAVTLPLLRGASLCSSSVTGSGAVMDAPPPYAERRNPRSGDMRAVAAGAALFADNCAPCHGERADGRGPASEGLDPPPADFVDGDFLAQRSDAYLYYRISEGAPGTAMPSFHGVLDDDERWALVAYIRSLESVPPSVVATGK